MIHVLISSIDFKYAEPLSAAEIMTNINNLKTQILYISLINCQYNLFSVLIFHCAWRCGGSCAVLWTV